MNTYSVLFLILSFSLMNPTIFAEAYQGEVVSTDPSTGSVTLRYRDERGQALSTRTFNYDSAVAPATDVQFFNRLRTGDRIQLDAANRNGTWRINSIGPLTAGSVLTTTGAATDSVLATSPRTAAGTTSFNSATGLNNSGSFTSPTTTTGMNAAGSVNAPVTSSSPGARAGVGNGAASGPGGVGSSGAGAGAGGGAGGGAS